MYVPIFVHYFKSKLWRGHLLKYLIYLEYMALVPRLFLIKKEPGYIWGSKPSTMKPQFCHVIFARPCAQVFKMVCDKEQKALEA